ncbi:MAG: YihY/virulence factor BrkB family protein [Pleurocapsa minor GSE-CHR-MK-17-07R]|jgi:membrane protein|nr:YihY/virulence factor BrkB family protein [Pleurocapsa minor GSE-CHR-MK 17-07R]
MSLTTFPRAIFDLLRETFQQWNADKAPRLAAALAYYTAFSIAPLLVIVIAIIGAVFSQEAARAQILSGIEETVSAQAAELVGGLIDSASQPRTGVISTVLGIGALLFGAMGAFGQLQGSLDVIWNVADKPPAGGIMGWMRANLLNFGMVLMIGFMLLVSLVLGTVITAISGAMASVLGPAQALLNGLNLVVGFALVTVMFALIFRFLPRLRIAWRDVWVGALVTAGLFTIGRYALSLYLSSSGTASAYGAAGAFVLILLWIYYSAQILLFGAEFTQVYARRYGSLRDLRPRKISPLATSQVPLLPPPKQPVPTTQGSGLAAVVFGLGTLLTVMVAGIFMRRR